MARKRTPARELVVAVIAAAVAVVTGIQSLGQPLRLPQMLTIVFASLAAGMSLATAISGFRTAARAREQAGS